MGNYLLDCSDTDLCIKDNNNKQNIEMFIKTITYKTDVNNTTVHNFIDRMKTPRS